MKFGLKEMFFLLFAGAAYMFSLFGCAGNFKYDTYSSKDPEINAVMDYISGWSYSESRGANDSFAQVVFYEPTKANDINRAGIVLTIEKESSASFSPLTVEAKADDLLSKRLKLKDAMVLSKTKESFLNNLDALEIELSYKMLDKLYAVDAKSVPFKEKIIIFKRSGRFYTLRYQSSEAVYDKFIKAFKHSAKSLKLK